MICILKCLQGKLCLAGDAHITDDKMIWYHGMRGLMVNFPWILQNNNCWSIKCPIEDVVHSLPTITCLQSLVKHHGRLHLYDFIEMESTSKTLPKVERVLVVLQNCASPKHEKWSDQSLLSCFFARWKMVGMGTATLPFWESSCREDGKILWGVGVYVSYGCSLARNNVI